MGFQEISTTSVRDFMVVADPSHRTTTVTLAAHARGGLITTFCFLQILCYCKYINALTYIVSAFICMQVHINAHIVYYTCILVYIICE